MRGAFQDQGGLFSYISLEERVPADHPLRKIRELVRAVRRFRTLRTSQPRAVSLRGRQQGRARLEPPERRVTLQKIEAVARILNKSFAKSTPFSRAYLIKATVDEIRITGDMLKIKGYNRTMADLVAANGVINGENQVLRFIPKWRALVDSNH